jgi:hypothetical protein
LFTGAILQTILGFQNPKPMIDSKVLAGSQAIFDKIYVRRSVRHSAGKAFDPNDLKCFGEFTCRLSSAASIDSVDDRF